LSLALQPWAEISQRLRRIFQTEPLLDVEIGCKKPAKRVTITHQTTWPMSAAREDGAQ
jgi:hypothetical protein